MDAPDVGPTVSAMVARAEMDVSDRTSATMRVTDIEREHGDALFGFARRQGIDDAVAEDVVQEALLRLYDAFIAGTLIEDPRAWTFTVCYRLAMDEHRRRERAARLAPVPDPAPSDADDPGSLIEQRAVWSEVDRLPERQRSVLYLRYRADLPFEAIGSVLGITASAARSHATQAVATLRLRLSAEGSR
jgi:RNA polymerase sigma factor (sigma-70 family)